MIREAAVRQGVDYSQFQRTNHVGLQVGTVRTTVGRHTEISNLTAEQLFKQLEPALGEDRWRKK